MDIVDVKFQLDIAIEALSGLRGQLDGSIKLDTALTLGELTGVCTRARELVERDIEDRKRCLNPSA